MSTIPIQNVYYLLCYAWDQMREGEIVETGALDRTELVDLFAQVLINGTRRVLRQGLDRGYVTCSEDTSRLRGAVDFNVSVRQALLQRARAHCHYDVLSRDVLHNRILKSTLWKLYRTDGLDRGLKADLLHLVRRFGEVKHVPLRRSLFRRVQLHGNNSFYRFLLNVCALVEQSLIVEEGGSRQRFRDFARDDAIMGRLFEQFVRNFYRHEQAEYEVSAPHIQWDVEAGDVERLPRMETDVVLQSEKRTIIIDTKYYSKTLQHHHGRQSYHSDNLYQLFTYLKNWAIEGADSFKVEGVLLYPTVSIPIDDQFSVQGHVMRVCTINLAQPWHKIQADLLSLVGIGNF